MGLTLEDIIMVAGGLGLLLFGMKMMSNGLETIAGNRMQHVLQRATSNRFLAVLVGIAATIAINSSTAATIMTVGFVNSGMLNLAQAIAIIMGANVGTTFSAQLIAFRIDAIAPLFIFIGIVMHLFFRKRLVKNIGYTILGFGILLFGVTVMGTPLRELANQPEFNALLTTFESPILALLVGFLFTAVVQSSSATMGILVALHLSDVPMSFQTSAFIILGTNIGTSITTVIASIPANRESKRAALFHIMFDVIGSTVFGTLIYVFPGILAWFQTTWSDSSARQVAMFHTLYNFSTMFIILPFVNQIAVLMEKIVPVKSIETDARYEKKLMFLDERILKTPSVAVLNAHLEVCRMGKIAEDNFVLSVESFLENDLDKVKKVLENEDVVNFLNHNIASKLVLINNTSLSDNEAERIGKMFRTLTDIERIADHAENIAEYTLTVENNGLKFSEDAIADIRTLSAASTELVSEALRTFEQMDVSRLPMIKSLEENVDKLSIQFIESHIKRLKAEDCEPESGVIFTDMVTDLERIGDHANNIAFSVIPESKWRRK